MFDNKTWKCKFRQYLDNIWHHKRNKKNQIVVAWNSQGNLVSRGQLQQLPSPLTFFQNQQTLFPAPHFLKHLSTSQFSINKMETNKVSNTTHSPSGVSLKNISVHISIGYRTLFLDFILNFLLNLHVPAEFSKNFEFMVFKSLENAFAFVFFQPPAKRYKIFF